MTFNATAVASLAFLNPFHFVNQRHPELRIYDLVPPAKPPSMVPTRETKAAAKTMTRTKAFALNLRRQLTENGLFDEDAISGGSHRRLSHCTPSNCGYCDACPTCDGSCWGDACCSGAGTGDDGGWGSGESGMNYSYSGATSDTCAWACDGMCDEPWLCSSGTDCTDCGNCNSMSPPATPPGTVPLTCGWGSDSASCSAYDEWDDYDVRPPRPPSLPPPFSLAPKAVCRHLPPPLDNHSHVGLLFPHLVPHTTVRRRGTRRPTPRAACPTRPS